MARHILEIRGYKIAVEAKSQTQVNWLRDLYQSHSDEFLAQVEQETQDIVDGTYESYQHSPKLTVVK